MNRQQGSTTEHGINLLILLYDYADRGGTVIFSTHNEHAAALAGRKITMHKGRIISNEISG